MNILVLIISSSIFVSLLALSGAALLLRKKLFTDQTITNLVSFAAGMLLATAFLDLLPGAAEGEIEISTLFLLVFSGIIVFFFLERFVLWFHHHDEFHGAKPSAVLILLGDALHNFIDGIAIAAAYITNPVLGFTTTLAIAAHEAPHEIADFAVLIAGGMKKTKALLFNLLSGLTAIAGAVLGFYFLDSLENLIPMALAFTGGMFIYIACSDLIPDLHRDFKERKNWTQSLPFILGIAVSVFIVRFLGG